MLADDIEDLAAAMDSLVTQVDADRNEIRSAVDRDLASMKSDTDRVYDITKWTIGALLVGLLLAWVAEFARHRKPQAAQTPTAAQVPVPAHSQASTP